MKDIKDINEILFPVFLCDNPKKTNSEYSKIVKAKIKNQVIHLNYCSPVFNLLKNSDVFPVVERMLQNYGVTKLDRSIQMNYDMTMFTVVYTIYEVNGVDVGIEIGNSGDKIYPTAIVENSYNGKANGSLMFGYYRMICSNGLIVPLEGKEEINFQIKGKHTSKLSFTFEQFKSKIELFLSSQDIMKKKFEVLTDKIVPTYEERILEVLVATDIATSDTQFRTIANIVKSEANTLKTDVNDFLIYNGINSHIFKGVDGSGNKSKALPEVKRKLDKKVFDYLVKN